MLDSNTTTTASGRSVAVLEREGGALVGEFEVAAPRSGSTAPPAPPAPAASPSPPAAPMATVLTVPTIEQVHRASIAHLTDDALMTLHSDLAELRQRTDSNLAVLADEIARRSHHTLGHDGLAQRLGSRTPENLIQRLTGVGAREASAMVRVGSMLAGAEGQLGADDRATATDLPAGATDLIASEKAWLRPLAVAVGEARLSVEAADAIGRGLGQPTASVTPAHLESTAAQLAAESTLLTVEQLAVRARQARALLDLEAESELIDEREAALRDRRYLHLTRQADGMTRLNALLDPESAALVRDAVDAATSPRRDGPRFVSASGRDADGRGAGEHAAGEPEADEYEADEQDRALRMLADTRTTPQIALDAVVELIRLGGEVAPTDVIGVRAPAVQVIVAERDLREGRGLAFFEGQTEPVGTATADRHVCASGVVSIVIDDAGDVVALGRESRLFTRRQRIALAARDGGCRFPGCDRPPSWTEAHHIVPWSSGGSTDLHDGVLLCRHHHLLLHNNGWRFARVDGDLHVIPPPDIDAEQRPIPTPSKSVPLERARAS